MEVTLDSDTGVVSGIPIEGFGNAYFVDVTVTDRTDPPAMLEGRLTLVISETGNEYSAIGAWIMPTCFTAVVIDEENILLRLWRIAGLNNVVRLTRNDDSAHARHAGNLPLAARKVKKWMTVALCNACHCLSIPASYGFEESGGKHFLVMELVGGDTVATRRHWGLQACFVFPAGADPSRRFAAPIRLTAQQFGSW
ncbi:MAG: hypothetical protein IH988_06720 [Planctomycetes bacterium]|nr:hypothetical protein [Planctomycetota bacterium]